MVSGGLYHLKVKMTLISALFASVGGDIKAREACFPLETCCPIKKKTEKLNASVLETVYWDKFLMTKTS